MNNVVVLDTNVLVVNPKAIFDFPDSLVVIPSVVIEELDNLKDSNNMEVRRMSRIACNYIDAITEENEGNDAHWMLLEHGGAIVIDEDDSVVFSTRFPDKPDNIIISTAIRYARKREYGSVVMCSNDTNVRSRTRTIARNQELKKKVRAKKYSGTNESLYEINSGIEDVILSEEEISQCRKNGEISLELPYINGEHLVLKSEVNPDKNQVLAIWDKTSRKAIPIKDYKKGEPIWRIGRGLKGASDVRPMDSRQAFLVNDLLDVNKNLHFVLSRKAGAGKNYIATACSLRLLEDGYYDRMIVIKPMISVGGQDIGFLPGEREDKLGPWFESFNDTMYELTNDGQGITMDLETRIDMEVVTFMRGRSIPNVIMIIDEAQNFTEKDLKTLITRAGKDSKIILMGDLSQIDNPKLDSDNNGLRIWAERARNKETGYDKSTYILLESNFRSELSDWASQFY